MEEEWSHYRIGHDSESKKDKWGFMAMEQDGDQWMEND